MGDTPESAWRGSMPLDNPIGVARLGAIYSGTAAFYDGLVGRQQAMAKLAALDILARRPGERFLEVGVGTGWAFGRVIADSGPGAAWALDVAEGMLTVARQRLIQQCGESPLLLGDARRMPFADAGFECVLNTYTLEVLPAADIAAVLHETLRVLLPGGRLVALNLTEGEGNDAAMIEDWKRRYVADPEFFGGARPLQLQPMLQAAGFIGVSRRYVGGEWPSEALLGFKPDTNAKQLPNTT